MPKKSRQEIEAEIKRLQGEIQAQGDADSTSDLSDWYEMPAVVEVDGKRLRFEPPPDLGFRIIHLSEVAGIADGIDREIVSERLFRDPETQRLSNELISACFPDLDVERIPPTKTQLKAKLLAAIASAAA